MDKIDIKLLGIYGLEGAYAAVQKPYGKKVDNPSELFYKVAKILKHESILEHIVFQFDVIGSSRLELQEHMRHRMASPTVKSTRYAFKNLPDEMRECQGWGEIVSFVKKDTVFTPRMTKCLNECVITSVNDIISHRYDSLSYFCDILEKHGADEAKYEIPECFRTSFIWTINARSMLNFLKLRTSKNAHFEIRHIANLMKDLLCENEEIKNLIGD